MLTLPCLHTRVRSLDLFAQTTSSRHSSPVTQRPPLALAFIPHSADRFPRFSRRSATPFRFLALSRLVECRQSSPRHLREVKRSSLIVSSSRIALSSAATLPKHHCCYLSVTLPRVAMATTTIGAIAIRLLCTANLLSAIVRVSASNVQRTNTSHGDVWYANVTGDLLLGGLFPVHRKGNDGNSCGEIQVSGRVDRKSGRSRCNAILRADRRRDSTAGSDAVHDRAYQRGSGDTRGRSTGRPGVRHLRQSDLRAAASVLLRQG